MSVKVLHCIPNLTGGGAERQLVYLLEASSTVGVQPHLAITGRGPNFQAAMQSGATIHEITAKSSHALKIPWNLWQIVKAIRPQVIQTWFRQMDIAAGAVAVLLRIPWVISERSSAEAYPPSAKHWVRLRLGRFAAAVAANSKSGLDYWSTFGNPRTSVLIQNCVPLARIDLAMPIAKNARGGEPKEPILIFAGRLSEEKNLPAFLEIIAALRCHMRVRAVVCGEGSGAAAGRRQAADLGLEKSVQFLGYVDNLWSLLKSADLFVSLSRFEGMPNTVLEAMACRCPVFLSDIPQHQELCSPGTAVFASKGPPSEVAMQIFRLLQDPLECRKRATEARLLVERRFSVGSVASEYVALYKSLLGQNTPVLGNSLAAVRQ